MSIKLLQILSEELRLGMGRLAADLALCETFITFALIFSSEIANGSYIRYSTSGGIVEEKLNVSFGCTFA